MDRLLPELDRLYGLGAQTSRAAGPDGGVRVAVLAVRQPAGWDRLGAVWRGVQSDLALPAPAIAVSGLDAMQLWFAFATPVPTSTAARFLQRLAGRYLPGLKPAQMAVFVEPDGLPGTPGAEVGDERWSAFVSPDLASVFGDTPWLDIPPGDDGQAILLRALEPMGPAVFEAALALLVGAADENDRPPRNPSDADDAAPGTAAPARRPEADPAGFLASVMNDAMAPLALRIEAAAILLDSARRR